MPESPRLTKPTRQTTERPQMKSASLLLLVTALDTTWRVFLPTVGGMLLGIGIDAWLGVAPIAVIVLTLLGIVASTLLIIQQLRSVRKSR